MTAKVCVITGANSGIGRAASASLAASGQTVVMLCRNPERGQAAQQAVIEQSGSDPERVQLLLMDLSRQASIRAGAQVLRNLLSNSLKFTAAGGLVTLRVSSKESSSVLFEVTDTGVGISAEDLRTILEPFRQAKRARAGGTGLGLPISSRLRRAMNSELRVHSQLGQGSCFSFSLPCAAPSLPSEEAAQSSGATPGSPVVKAAPRPLELLLVDDNDEAREVISGLLEQLSCEIKTARDGLEALELVTIRRPEVVLLDIQMPRLGGVETAKELRRRFPAGEFPSLKLIAVTGNSDAQGELSQSGLFDQVIAKPVGLAQLEAGLLEVTCRQARAD